MFSLLLHGWLILGASLGYLLRWQFYSIVGLFLAPLCLPIRIYLCGFAFGRNPTRRKLQFDEEKDIDHNCARSQALPPEFKWQKGIRTLRAVEGENPGPQWKLCGETMPVVKIMRALPLLNFLPKYWRAYPFSQHILSVLMMLLWQNCRPTLQKNPFELKTFR